MNREQWLLAGLAHIRELAASKDYVVPERIRVSCGLPSQRPFSAKNARIGEHWNPSASADGHAEIFVSPVLDDPIRVLDVLLHEAVHAIVGTEAGHKGAFKQCAVALGLEGKMTATHAGPELREWLRSLVLTLGPYPHAKLSRPVGLKKQSTRMLKVECPDCGYTVRTTMKWLEQGIPTCACGVLMKEAS